MRASPPRRTAPGQQRRPGRPRSGCRSRRRVDALACSATGAPAGCGPSSWCPSPPGRSRSAGPPAPASPRPGSPLTSRSRVMPAMTRLPTVGDGRSARQPGPPRGRHGRHHDDQVEPEPGQQVGVGRGVGAAVDVGVAAVAHRRHEPGHGRTTPRPRCRRRRRRTSRPNTTRRPSPSRTAHTQSGSLGPAAPRRTASRMRSPIGSVLIVPGGSSPARALPGLGGHGGRRLAATIGGDAGRGTAGRGAAAGSSVSPVSRLAISRPSADSGWSRAWANWSAGDRPARSTAPIDRAGRGPHDQLGRPGVPARGLGEGGEHARVERAADDAAGPEHQSNRHAWPCSRPPAWPRPKPAGGGRCARAASSIADPVARMSVPPNKDASLPEHPDLEAEQAYIDHAYDCLEEARVAGHPARVDGRGRPGAAPSRPASSATSSGTRSWPGCASSTSATPRSSSGASTARPTTRSDRPTTAPSTSAASRSPTSARSRSSSTGGRRWPSPSTGPPGGQPMGLRPAPPLRHPRPHPARHRGRAVRRGRRAARRRRPARPDGVSGHGALIAALETRADRPAGRHRRHHPGRAGRDHPRPSCRGVLVVQGGPGTGKTVVALHRAAYLLYTHRFPLEGQGVLVVGPNRLFLGYIEQVLPSLGEAGVELAVLADLVPDPVTVRRLRRPRRRPGSRATCAWPRCWPRRCATGGARCADDLRRRLRRPDPAAHRGRRAPASSPTPGGGPAPTTRPGGSSSRGLRGAGRAAAAATSTRRRCATGCAATPTVRGRARVDVAGAHAGRAAPRPVRLARPCSRLAAGRRVLTDDERDAAAPASGRRRPTRST